MFDLSNEPLEIEVLRDRLNDDRAGAFCSFEGRVRNHNDGRSVTMLEYEAYGALAVKEGERILREAKEKFGIYDAYCVHRTGELRIGDVAVFVGVLSAHRGEAFEACRYIIDEVKHRLPIWKKEHYADGDSGWVNCETHCHGSARESATVNQMPAGGRENAGNIHEHVSLDKNGESFAQWAARRQAERTAIIEEDGVVYARANACGKPRLTGADPMEGTSPMHAADNNPDELDILDLSSADLAKFEIVDIREPYEDPSHILKSLLRCDVKDWPLSTFAFDKPPIEADKKYLFVCAHGVRSKRLVDFLREKGFPNVYSLVDGFEAVRRKYIA